MHEEDIRQVATSFLDAWNERQVPSMTLLFTDDVEAVNSLGLWWRGSAEVIHGLQAMSAFGASMTTDSISVRVVTQDAAICIVACTVSSFVGPDGRQRPEQQAVMTLFLVNRGRWLIAGAQTTAVNADVIAQIITR
jgi:uncharacterized protein (TIGR02246 family)